MPKEQKKQVAKVDERIHKPDQGVYKCTQCERTYLSYPALYTHTKIKHRNQNLIQQLENTPIQTQLKKEVEEHKLIGENAGPVKIEKANVIDLPFEDAYKFTYKEEKKYGGYQNHPLYLELKKQNTQPKPTENKEDTQVSKFSNEELEQKRQKMCDEVFAEYLLYTANHVDEKTYKETQKHILLYRECLNHYSLKLNEEKKELPSALALKECKIKEKDSTEYCLISNAEQMPDISNEFITEYLPKIKPEFDSASAMKMTITFCHWLFTNGYSCSLISQCPEKDNE
jgi:hypothetical protein